MLRFLLVALTYRNKYIDANFKLAIILGVVWIVLISTKFSIVGVIFTIFSLILLKYYEQKWKKYNTAYLGLGNAMKGKVCKIGGWYYIIKSLSLQDYAVIWLGVETIKESKDGNFSVWTGAIPFNIMTLHQVKSYRTVFNKNGLKICNDISVEHNALKVAIDCIKQMSKIATVQGNIKNSLKDVHATLLRAPGNELLSPMIPKLREFAESYHKADTKYTNEYKKLKSNTRKIFEYLKAPDSIKTLEEIRTMETLSNIMIVNRSINESYSELVNINDVFVKLCQKEIPS